MIVFSVRASRSLLQWRHCRQNLYFISHFVGFFFTIILLMPPQPPRPSCPLSRPFRWSFCRGGCLKAFSCRVGIPLLKGSRGFNLLPVKTEELLSSCQNIKGPTNHNALVSVLPPLCRWTMNGDIFSFFFSLVSRYEDETFHQRYT